MEEKNSNIDFPLLIITLILILIGLIMIMSASGVRAYNQYGNAHYFFFQAVIICSSRVIINVFCFHARL